MTYHHEIVITLI